MIKQLKLAAAIATGALALSSIEATAMPAASKDVVEQSAAAAGLEQAHAVWVCRNGRCWWSSGGHYHGGGYGWGGHHHGGWGWGGHHGWGHHGHRGHRW